MDGLKLLPNGKLAGKRTDAFHKIGRMPACETHLSSQPLASEMGGPVGNTGYSPQETLPMRLSI